MPQIIDKELFIEVTTFFKPYEGKYPLCEWSTYFNYSTQNHPSKFFEPEAFMTLCWPEHPLAWKFLIPPQCYVFENYTPSLFKNILNFDPEWNNSKDLAELKNINIEKIIRWKKYEIACKHPEQASNFRKYFNPRVWVNKLFINQ
ncbi:MAG: hypothetical protein JKX81_17405, partial [Arenicella sp.]|nr:hypothetical protein [Arenicella sp.]